MLAIAGGSISGLLLFDHHGVGAASGAVDQICGADTAGGGCQEVSDSAYSSVGGVSVAAIGLFFYGSMLLLVALSLVSSVDAQSALGPVVFLAFAFALAIDLGLLAVQAFAIGAFCKLCLATYAVNLVAVLVALPWARRLATANQVFVGPGGRALSVWAMGSLVLLVASVATDRAFGSSRDRAPADLLGASSGGMAAATPEAKERPNPPMETTPEPHAELEPEPDPVQAEPEATGPTAESVRIESLEGELARLQERILELETTLDDPQKYQEYQMAQATRAFEQTEAVELSLDGIPFKGPAEAPVKVVEFSDFLCPYCRNLAGALSNYLPESNGNVAIYYKNYPLDQACNPALSRTIHDGACELALGAVCAEEQGKFWEYHDRVFGQPPPNPTNDDVVAIAVGAGLDGELMGACLESGAAAAALKAQIDEAQSLEVRSTPTVYINGKKLEQISSFLTAIESELK